MHTIRACCASVGVEFTHILLDYFTDTGAVSRYGQIIHSNVPSRHGIGTLKTKTKIKQKMKTKQKQDRVFIGEI